uniref:Cytochrome b561 and DOMON domain-containing protein n=1 Tax=Nelumbo nucifera TaxID=4432 RepID=A0A822XR37_NELNU|nr:TPA_asm: hypothetical protein HUJ06_025527 [Nelumbo nucifera]
MASSSYLSPVILGLLVLLLQIHSSHSLTCSSQTFTSNRLFQNCNDLPHLSSYLHWTYDSSNSSLKIAFVAPPAQPEGWVSWAINPKSTGMAGSQALIAYQANGSVVVDQYDVQSYQSVDKTKISFDLWDVTGEYSDGVMRIFATFALPKNMTTLNQVWQVGASLSGGVPAAHAFKAENLNSKGTLDLMAGTSSTSSGGDSKLTKRNVHGILNAVSWGILFPVGIIIARYIRTFQSADPAWFYLHVSCQIIAYGLGVAGWATGIKLGNQPKRIQYTAHRNLGIALFSFATLQVLIPIFNCF